MLGILWIGGGGDDREVPWDDVGACKGRERKGKAA